MTGSVEHRTGVEFRVHGRTLSGVAMRYFDVSPGHREMFEPGAYGNVPTIMPVNLQHDRSIIVADRGVLADFPRELRVRADLQEGSAALALVRRGALNGFSVEFNAIRERLENGVRVIEKAELVGLALVDRGSYPAAKAEVRARSGRTMRAEIPTGRRLACACAGGSCQYSEILPAAMEEMWDRAFTQGTRQVAAAYLENYSTPLASTSRGTLRGQITGAGGYQVDIDIPDSTAGRSLIEAWEASGIVVRPFIDELQAEVVDGVQRIQGGRLRAFIATATDQREGWPDPEMLPTPEDLVQRSAPDTRRRIWL